MPFRLFLIAIFLLQTGLAEEINELVAGKIYTGAEPTAETWKLLGEKNISIVVSVDGTKPDLETAAANGLTYVHLPIGYDGVSNERRIELASLLKHTEGSIYLHCHHGKHRGPAAAAIAALSNNLVTKEEALHYLKQQKTSLDYQGLWEAVRVTNGVADIPKLQFENYVPPGDLTHSMVEIDRTWERIQLVRTNDWITPEKHPDLSLKNELTMLHEYLFEAHRLELAATESLEDPLLTQAYTESLDAVQTFRKILDNPEPHPDSHEKAYLNVKTSCKSCHKTFRN